jgi:hypothetical protein
VGSGELWRLVYECAGIIGVDPSNWTLRELIIARDGREWSDWWHTAAIQSLIANVNKSPTKPAYTVYDFHPYATKPKKQISVEELEKMLMGQL